MNPKTAIDSTGADELNRLRNTIETIDSLSQSGFGEIEAIAKLALNALENPKTDEDPDTISGALMTIIGKAQRPKESAAIPPMTRRAGVAGKHSAPTAISGGRRVRHERPAHS